MSKYPTITLGGYITPEEVTELAALLAKNDYYPAIMAGEGLLDRECDDLEHEARGRFYLDAIYQSIQEGQPFRFGTGDPDWRTDRLGSAASDRIPEQMEIWLAAKAIRLISRRYTPEQSIVLHGCGWGGQSVRLDTDDNPVINLPDHPLKMKDAVEEFSIHQVVNLLHEVDDARWVFWTRIPPLICVRDKFFEQEQGAEYQPLPRRPPDRKISLILE